MHNCTSYIVLKNKTIVFFIALRWHLTIITFNLLIRYLHVSFRSLLVEDNPVWSLVVLPFHGKSIRCLFKSFDVENQFSF